MTFTKKEARAMSESKTARETQFGRGRIDIGVDLLTHVLTEGMTTGTKSIACVRGLPEGAELRKVEFHNGRCVSFTFRSPSLPAMKGASAEQIDIAYQPTDVEKVTAAAIVERIRGRLQEVATGRRRGWWARLTRRNAGADLTAAALVLMAAEIRDHYGLAPEETGGPQLQATRSAVPEATDAVCS